MLAHARQAVVHARSFLSSAAGAAVGVITRDGPDTLSLLHRRRETENTRNKKYPHNRSGYCIASLSNSFVINRNVFEHMTHIAAR